MPICLLELNNLQVQISDVVPYPTHLAPFFSSSNEDITSGSTQVQNVEAMTTISRFCSSLIPLSIECKTPIPLNS